ncbi:hypothetical protein QVA66_08615 [Staphylococcus chromogenes]|nr:hypothetical protein [Staphylococcus chromogenes]
MDHKDIEKFGRAVGFTCEDIERLAEQDAEFLDPSGAYFHPHPGLPAVGYQATRFLQPMSLEDIIPAKNLVGCRFSSPTSYTVRFRATQKQRIDLPHVEAASLTVLLANVEKAQCQRFSTRGELAAGLVRFYCLDKKVVENVATGRKFWELDIAVGWGIRLIGCARFDGISDLPLGELLQAEGHFSLSLPKEGQLLDADKDLEQMFRLRMREDSPGVIYCQHSALRSCGYGKRPWTGVQSSKETHEEIMMGGARRYWRDSGEAFLRLLSLNSPAEPLVQGPFLNPQTNWGGGLAFRCGYLFDTPEVAADFLGTDLLDTFIPEEPTHHWQATMFVGRIESSELVANALTGIPITRLQVRIGTRMTEVLMEPLNFALNRDLSGGVIAGLGVRADSKDFLAERSRDVVYAETVFHELPVADRIPVVDKPRTTWEKLCAHARKLRMRDVALLEEKPWERQHPAGMPKNAAPQELFDRAFTADPLAAEGFAFAVDALELFLDDAAPGALTRAHDVAREMPDPMVLERAGRLIEQLEELLAKDDERIDDGSHISVGDRVTRQALRRAARAHRYCDIEVLLPQEGLVNVMVEPYRILPTKTASILRCWDVDRGRWRAIPVGSILRMTVAEAQFRPRE